jgi:rhodanese-related sulfurtransferase
MKALIAFLFACALAASPTLAADGMISADEAAARAAEGELTIIDVRSPREWRDTGVPEGAKTVTIHHSGGMEGFLADVTAAVNGDKDRPIAFICAAGGRSSRAQSLAREAGFTEVADIDEGMLGSGSGPGWIARGLPTEPCDC